MIRFRRVHRDAKLPTYATTGAAGMDLYSVDEVFLRPSAGVRAGAEIALLSTGWDVEIDSGYEGQIRPRSSLAAKHGVTVLNSPGTIDSDYRGPLMVCLINHGAEGYTIAKGERIAQLVLSRVHRAEPAEVEALTSSARGRGGFGSTGRF